MRSRRARDADDKIPRGLVSVNGRRSLTIAAEEVAWRNIDELEFCRIVMELECDGSDVSGAVQHDGDLEGCAGSRRGGGRIERESGAGGRHWRGSGCG